MHKFLVRAGSGIVYAAVIILCITYGGWALWAMAIAFAIIGVCEFDKMAMGYSRQTLPLYIIDIIGALSLICLSVCSYAIILFLAAQIIRLIFYRNIKSKDPKQRISSSDVMLYLGLPMCLMVFDPMVRIPLLIFVMLWLNDSGAYIVGSLIGRHKLCPSISPNKTWEGFFGGIAITILGSFLLFKLCPSFFGMEQYGVGMWMILAVSTCIFGTLGDLLESKIKRIYGVKDSGHWIPGHGGILDRIDSFLIAFPAAFIIMLILN